MSRRMRSRCQYSSAKPMSKRIPDKAKPMSRRMRSRYEDTWKSSQNLLNCYFYRVRWERVPCELGGKVSRASCVGMCPVQVGWDTFPPNSDGERSHPTRTGHVPTLLARDTFPLNSDGTRSHLTQTENVPTQLYYFNAVSK